MKCMILAGLAALVVFSLSYANAYTALRPIPLMYDQSVGQSSYAQVAEASAPDLDSAATGHGHYGRVQIKVYRGPSTHHEHFAPHGFWVKQPADDHH